MKKHSLLIIAAIGTFFCISFFVGQTGIAQAIESEYAPLKGKFEPGVPPKLIKPFMVPDVPDSLLQIKKSESHWLKFKVGFVLLGDYTAFTQDNNSITQVSKQKNQGEFRASRLMFRGSMGRHYHLGYLLAGEFKGFEKTSNSIFELTDVSLIFPLSSPATKLTVGKTKETFAYEMVGDAGNLPQQERILSPFFVSRNIGIKINHVIGKAQRMTAAAGVFNDWFVNDVKFSERATDITARFTGLALDKNTGINFLHLGISGRYVSTNATSLRYRGRPESNVTDYFVDTQNLTGNHATHVGLEGLWNQGSFSILAEYNHAWVDASAIGNPQFSGYYVTASWVLTGETRHYDRTVGYARRVMPTHRWGAPELVARFSHLDLNDGVVTGGQLAKTYLGINWWATRRWKAGFGWGHAWLDRFGITGITDSYHSRLQWIF